MEWDFDHDSLYKNKRKFPYVRTFTGTFLWLEICLDSSNYVQWAFKLDESEDEF